MTHRRAILAACLLLAAVLAAACGPGGRGQPQEQPGAGPAGPGGVVRVLENEWTIQIQDPVPSGPVTFSVQNRGAVEHNLVIQETGQRVDGIAPGQTKTLQVTLRPGTYNVVCDIPGHSEAGMTTTMTVR